MESIEIQKYYPRDLIIKEINDTTNKIILKMKSNSRNSICPKCKNISYRHHGTYIRKVQDLPILGKSVELQINAYDYHCDNEECDVKSFAETFDNFIDNYSRKTERLSDFICTTALETSCEGCARVCKAMNIKISGDTVIRMLLRKMEERPETTCSSTVGIDDFAFKKRKTYGTIIVDEQTRKTVALLSGRDGTTLKEWLRMNQHIKTITRDRASAYSSAIEEMLPNAMQIADRFHLHQNFLKAVKDTLNGNIPSNIKIPIENEEPVKKM